MLAGKKTVDSILAPFAKMKADLEGLMADRRKAIETRNERITVLKIENDQDDQEIQRAALAAEHIASIGL